MHSIRIHKVIALMISVFYLIGFWHRGDKPTARELRNKFFYCIYYLLFLLSLTVGAIINENQDTSIFLAEASIEVGVLAIKLWTLIWKQKEILELLNLVCDFPKRDRSDVTFVNRKFNKFMKFVIVFLIATLFGGVLEVGIFPFLGSEKTVFLEIGFPVHYKNNEIAFWIANFFLLTEYALTMTAIFFSTIIWYLLLACSLRYRVLGNDLRRMGQISGDRQGKMSRKQTPKYFFEDLTASIDAHIHLRGLAKTLESFLSDLFLIRFGTSSLCICGSIYCLAFDVTDNSYERLIHVIMFDYFIAELFMITYFGNEIKLSSNRLSYCLFESNWIEQPQSTKKCIIIFSEYLKQPQEFVVGKLYPITLETFTRILNSAYSMFNILESFQK